MILAPDNVRKFQEAGAGLVPEDETVRAAIRALPRGEPWRRSREMNLRIPVAPKPTTIDLEGKASGWPARFALHEADPNAYSTKIDWFFWIVITDKAMHVFEGHVGTGLKDEPTAGPEGMRFGLDEIQEIWFDQNAGISQLSISFDDGSSIDLDVGRQDFDAFRAVIAPFERPDSQLARKTGWMPNPFRWSLGIALVVGGMATGAGSDGEVGTAKAVLIAVTIGALLSGTYFVLRAWRIGGWRRQRVGIVIAVLGILFAATALDDTCACRGMLYFGVTLVAIGVIPQFTRRDRG